MAALDKTYVNKEQLLEAIEWAKKVDKATLEDGSTFYPINFICGYNDIDDPAFWEKEKKEYVLWNTPTWYDRWLWLNCPLSFVQERLQVQYDSYTLEVFESWTYEEPVNRKKKYTFLTVPTGYGYKWFMNNARYNCRWPRNSKQLTYYIEVKCPDEEFDRGYNKEVGQWYPDFDFLPCRDEFIWQKYHKRIPSKKSIMRQLDKWDLPKGTIVTVGTMKYNGLNFKILVK
jgi:hypothetical protein